MSQTVSASTDDSVSRARETIAKGGILAYPTDTLYGLGVDAFSAPAVKRLSAAKGRSGPFSLMVGSVDQLAKILLVPTPDLTHIRRMLPGPYAIISRAVSPEMWPTDLLGTDETLSVRIAGNRWLSRLFDGWEGVIVTTSANRASESPLAEPSAISKTFGATLALIIDDGPAGRSTGSTMLNITTTPWQLVRQGDGVWPR